MQNSFHYAFKVIDLASTRDFYTGILGCKEGRSTDTWVDFDFFGNQISAHLATSLTPIDKCGDVDGVSVPIPHFGCLLTVLQFELIQQKLEAKSIKFIVEPQVRYKSKAAEQLSLFVLDYSGNALEFKAFKNRSEIYQY